MGGCRDFSVSFQGTDPERVGIYGGLVAQKNGVHTYVDVDR